MYKYLLCWRYLRTRYIALASVVSVMLGVATMIVVNSVMAGFSDEDARPAPRRPRRRRRRVVRPRRVLRLRRGDGADQGRSPATRSRRWPRRWRRSALHEVPASAASRSPGQVQIIGIQPDGAGQDRRLRRVPLRRARSRQRSPPSFEVPETVKQQHAGRRAPEGARRRPERRVRPGHAGRAQGADRRAGPRPRRDHRLRAGDDPPHGDQGGRVHRAAGHEDRAGLPQGRQDSPRPGYDDVHGRRLLQERHERVRLDPRLRPARAAAGDAAAGRRAGPGGGQPDPDQGQAGRRHRRARRRSSRRRSSSSGRCTSGSRPGSRSRGRCWRRSRSSRAS